MSRQIKDQKLFIRLATFDDVRAICDLNAKVYGDNDFCFSAKTIKSHITTFPEGQFVALFEGELVGHAATFIIDEKTALSPHSWKEITGNGYASRHNPDGDFLYGMEVCVDPNIRGNRIGQRLYNMRKNSALNSR